MNKFELFEASVKSRSDAPSAIDFDNENGVYDSPEVQWLFELWCESWQTAEEHYKAEIERLESFAETVSAKDFLFNELQGLQTRIEMKMAMLRNAALKEPS